MMCETLAAFAACFEARGRLCGLDVGTKTIGLALCDAQWIIASPAHTIARTKFTTDIEALGVFCAREAVEALVIGLPLNMDGSDSPRTQSVRAFARNLDTLWPGTPILLWDERWSTVAVERAMISQDLSRAKRAAAVDRAAAAYILQGAIDGLRGVSTFVPSPSGEG
jgi:putative holliday junction resolvase